MRIFSLAALTLTLAACADKTADTDTAPDAVDVDDDGYDADADCDDYDAAVHPGAEEVPYNGDDEDCDGLSDDQDVDGDGAAIDVDCDDNDAAVNPDAAEVCDGIDNDCDGGLDVGAEDAFVAWTDLDLDGFGDAASPVDACELTAGVVDNDLDCDDTSAAIHPSAQEVCNDVDDDCDGEVNEGDLDLVDYYLDADADGYGDAAITMRSCTTPAGYAATGDDCDDASPAVNPGAVELCDDVDLDCDGDAYAGATDAGTYYLDLDGDTYGDAAAGTTSCAQPDGTVADATDCADDDAAVNPGAAEVCDGADQDCDGAADEDLDYAVWYADMDDDGYGDAGALVDACAQPEGYVGDDTDCDDTDAMTWPGADELCDELDNDCDGSVDDGATDARTWHFDADGDGYGDPATTETACSLPADYVMDANDCDDTDATEYPGATEVCDGDDDDCDGMDDEADAADAATWYADADDDGFGDAATMEMACEQPAGFLADWSDCDDADASAFPGGTEVCGGGDENCDGTTDEAAAADATTWYADADGDGYGDMATTQLACAQPASYVATATDCDDDATAVNPGATESCNDIDDDCDGAADEAGAEGEATFYADADGDGFGVDSSTTMACDVPAGFAAMADDCDDADGTAYPTAAEADDGVDDDCDAWVDEDFVVEGDVIFTEVAKQPWAGLTSTNSNAYWFEIYNTSARTVDLSNWYFSHTAGTTTDGFYVDPAEMLTLAPGEFAVFCKTDNFEGDTTSTSYPLYCDYYWGDETQASSWAGTYADNTFNLNRDDGNLAAWIEGSHTDGVEIDGVHWTYDATNGYWPRDAMRSISLDPASMDGSGNDALTSWCSTAASTSWRWWSGSNTEYGSPGAANYDCP